MPEEHRFDFEGSMSEFLDAAYRPPIQDSGEPRPVAGPPGGKARDVHDLLFNARIGRQQYGPQAFALLVHPVDKMNIEMWWLEDKYGSLDPDKIAPDEFEGLKIQPAVFVPEGTYMVIGKIDHDKLVGENPELA